MTFSSLLALLVTGLRASGYIKAQWQPNAATDNVISYNVYRRQHGAYVLLTNVAGVTATLVDQRGYYAVSAINPFGEGPRCAAVKFP